MRISFSNLEVECSTFFSRLVMSFLRLPPCVVEPSRTVGQELVQVTVKKQEEQIGSYNYDWEKRRPSSIISALTNHVVGGVETPSGRWGPITVNVAATDIG